MVRVGDQASWPTASGLVAARCVGTNDAGVTMRRNRNLAVDVCMYAGILMLGIVVIAALCGWWAPVE
jgi:CHASE2 domain-containing sensor protein